MTQMAGVGQYSSYYVHFNMIDLIREEIKKDNPDWLLISNLSQKLYLESSKPNLLGIREGIINLVKVGAHGVGDVVDLLEPIFPGKVIVAISFPK